MSQGWVALLRAVNLGGRNKVPMAELRALLAGDGFEDVRSYIASGNLLFVADERDEATVARRVERLVREAFAVETTAIMRTWAQLRQVVERHPFPDASQTFVTFLARRPQAAAARRLAGLDAGDDEFELAGREVYARYPNGYRAAQVNAASFERALGVAGTARNWRTVTALAGLAAESS